MGSHRFRIRFNLTSKGVLCADSSSLTAALADGSSLILVADRKESPISESNTFILTGGAYETDPIAWEAGRRAKDALLLACASMRIAVDGGNDKPRGFLHSSVKDIACKAGKTTIRDDVHGLTTYNSSELTSFSHISAVGLIVQNDGQRFVDEVADIFSLEVRPSAKQRLALELLGFARFETSERARFLTCMLAYEALLEREERGRAALDLLEDLGHVANESDIDRDEKDSLMSALSRMKSQSNRENRALSCPQVSWRQRIPWAKG